MPSVQILQLLQTSTHYGLHFLFPGLIAWIFFKNEWQSAWLIMVGTMLVDLDHFLAVPVFDPTRCSIGFHPLHSYPAIALYFLMVFSRNTKVKIGAVGLLFHMFTDFLDCLWMMFIV